MSRFRIPQTEDELRAAGFLVGLFIVAFWAGAGISPNPQVVGLVAFLIGQKMLPSRKAIERGEPGKPFVEMERSPNGDQSKVDRPRDGISHRARTRRLQQRPC